MKSRKLVAFVLIGAAVVVASVFVVMQQRVDPVNAFMAEHYGEYDATTKQWAEPPLENQNLAYAICAMQEVRIKDEPHTMLAVCGVERNASQGASQFVDLYVLVNKEGMLQPAASLQNASSSNGSEFGTSVTIVRLGREFYGFEIASSFVAQGYVIPGLTIFVPNKDSLVSALSMATGSDNSGTGNCDEQSRPDENASVGCVQMERVVHINESDPKLRVFPIDVTETRQSNDSGKQVKTRKITLRFDPSQWKFVAPKDFELTALE
jgi:hypothetical protein